MGKKRAGRGQDEKATRNASTSSLRTPVRKSSEKYEQPSAIVGRLQQVMEMLGFVKKNGKPNARAFALHVGISDRAIQSYLSGDRAPDVGVVQQISRQAPCNVNWLLTGEGSPHPTQLPETEEARRDYEETWRAILATVEHAADALAKMTGRIDPTAVKEVDARRALSRLVAAQRVLEDVLPDLSSDPPPPEE
jgi:hypothetical protein